VKEEVGGIWKEAIVIYFKLISLDFHGGTKWNHENSEDIRVSNKQWIIQIALDTSRRRKADVRTICSVLITLKWAMIAQSL
jgi:hypothetical protein